jgi:hypothetical protein
MIIFLLWRVWHHRNNVVHGDGKASITASVNFLQSYVVLLEGLNQVKVDVKGKSKLIPELQPLTMSDAKSSEWHKPLEGCLKINIDAGWDAHMGRAGIGIIARDHTRQPVRSIWQSVDGCAGAEEVELLAFSEGLCEMESRCKGPGLLESDCANVVSALHSVGTSRSSLWCLLAESQAILRGRPDFEIQKINRLSNKVAHCLVQLGKSVCGVLDGAGPPCVAVLLVEDCMNPVLP